MLKIVECVQNNQLCDTIPGIAYRTHDNIRENVHQHATSIPMDELPFPERDDLNYLAEHNETVSIISSKGCWAKCKFCSTPRMYPNGREERSLDIMYREIDYLLEHGIHRFSFWDEDFYGIREKSIERATKIIQYIKRNNAKITFTFISAPGIIKADTLGYIHEWENVVERVYCGIEGGCTMALKNLGNLSCMNSTMNSLAIHAIRKYNIALQIGFIMFNPYSSYEELEQSAKFLYDHDETVNSVSFFHRIRPYPGTELYNELQQNGLLIEHISHEEFDLHTTLAYRFKNPEIKDIAESFALVESNPVTSTVDRLNIEIMSEIVKSGDVRQLFTDDVVADKDVAAYKNLRHNISELNYRFFLRVLHAFRADQPTTFPHLQEEYLEKMHEYSIHMQGIKEHMRRPTRQGATI